MKKKISWLLTFIFLFTTLFSGFSHNVIFAENLPAETSFEAESPSNDITGAIGITGDDLASGKTIANNINYQTSLTFKNINIETAGTYMITIYYVSGQQRNLTMSVNGLDPTIVTCPEVKDNDWSSVGKITTPISLIPGKNNITFSCDAVTMWGPNLDRIVINVAATQDPPEYPSFTGNLYEAESTDNTFEGATVVDNVNAHGGKYVKVDNNPGLTFNKVHADEDGYYTLTVLYAAGDNNRLIYLTVNGVDVVKIKTPSTGYWDKIGKAEAVIFLNKGDNILAFRNKDAGYPDIWAPYLDAITITPGAVGPVPIPIAGDSYEAEDAELSKAAVVQDNQYSSGNKQVGNLGGAKNGSVTFKNIKAVSSGNYTLSLFYVTALSDASLSIRVNNKSPMLISCIKTDMNDKRGARIDVNITLDSGNNTIKIDNEGLSSPQLDRIVVNKGNTAFEAEAKINTLSETADKVDNTLASGGATIGNIGGNGSTNGSVTINGINVDKTGKYLLKIYYVSGSDRAFDVSINSLPAISVNCKAVIANDWSTVGSIDVMVSLTKGLNTINFDNRTGYSPQLDKVEIGNLSETPAPEVNNNIINLKGGKVRIAYNLETGTADYYTDGEKKISGFYAAVKQTTGEDMSLSSGLITSKMYTEHKAKTVGDETIITSTKTGYPTMKQHFTLVGGSYFLTQVELSGTTLSSNWMAPMMTDSTGGVDIGKYSDERALFVPYDNDAWTRYNAKSVNGLNTSYEVSAFYDNTSKNGLVIGSVTHDTWKTGIYSSGSLNKLDKLYVYGGASTGSNKLAGGTHDVSVHGSITGSDIYSPKIFVGFYKDWSKGMEEFADANTAVVSKLAWADKVPFGWNSWGKLQTNITYDKAIAVSDFIHNSLQNKGFSDDNVVYVNLDSYWDNMTDAQLKQFVDNCKANGQKAGIYWTPFVDWGNAAITLVAPGSAYTYNDIWLRNSNGDPIYNNGSKVVDPTHPGTRDRIDYFVKRFTDEGFEFIKIDFLTHGALEGVHYDKTVQTGTQAFNQGMAYFVKKLDGKMFISEAISPLFPYQYGNSRRIACDAFGSISDSEYTLNASTYSWWTNGKLYKFNDPDEIVFEGFTPNENITRVNSAVVSGTVYLNGDDLSRAPGQILAKQYLTNSRVNDVAKKGKAFKAVEYNTGSSASDEFVMQDGSDYYLAIFNYGSSDVTKAIDFARAGIPSNKKYTVTNLWDNTCTTEASSMNVTLSSNQSKLLKLSVAK
ncbi:MAG TPA: CBM35 domain-containing protein [Ruminiclostridium sp.]